MNIIRRCSMKSGLRSLVVYGVLATAPLPAAEGPATPVSRGPVQGATWTYEDENMMGGHRVRTRVTMKELSLTSYAFRMEALAADGMWTPLIESRATRVRSE
jgi:hypothetical protein